mmetsp:Transcript_174189/g.558578  ORF Transcript_174189/g.558578 Transcript_174189/m.558578 type:complete len:84 (+) Transcript_174189:150-401(+)
MEGMDVDNAFAGMDLLNQISDAKSPLCVFTIRGCNHHFEGKLGFQSDDSNLTLEQCTIRYICDRQHFKSTTSQLAEDRPSCQP